MQHISSLYPDLKFLLDNLTNGTCKYNCVRLSGWPLMRSLLSCYQIREVVVRCSWKFLLHMHFTGA
jgi:hypothetical protein